MPFGESVNPPLDREQHSPCDCLLSTLVDPGFMDHAGSVRLGLRVVVSFEMWVVVGRITASDLLLEKHGQ